MDYMGSGLSSNHLHSCGFHLEASGIVWGHLRSYGPSEIILDHPRSGHDGNAQPLATSSNWQRPEIGSSTTIMNESITELVLELIPQATAHGVSDHKLCALDIHSFLEKSEGGPARTLFSKRHKLEQQFLEFALALLLLV